MSLDIDEPQVLVQYPDDDLEWHHRVLLRRLRDATWIMLTPDLNIEVADLGEHTLLPPVRAAPLPADVADRCYTFGGNLDGRLAGLHVQAA